MKRRIFSKSTLFSLIAVLLFPALVKAQTEKIMGLLGTIISRLIEIGAIIALIGLIVSGYKYISAGGNPEAMQQAKNAALYSILGLIVVLTAVIVVGTVIGRLGGDISLFGISGVSINP